MQSWVCILLFTGPMSLLVALCRRDNAVCSQDGQDTCKGLGMNLYFPVNTKRQKALH